MRKLSILASLILLFGFLPAVESAIVYMNDGSVIEGEIEKKTKYKIEIRQGENLYTIYRDEYSRIDEGYIAHDLDIDPAQWGYISIDKARKIIKFIQVSGTHSNIVSNLESVISSAPEEKQLELRRMLNANEITASLVPIYDKYYSEEDLVALIAFYGSAVGQKHIEATPKIMQDTINESVKYIQNKQNE